MRRTRLNGQEPVAALDRPPDGRRISAGLIHAPTVLSGASPGHRGVIACRYCGRQLGPADQNIKSLLILHENPTGYRWPLTGHQPGSERFVVRQFYCPHCATQLDVEVNVRGLAIAL